VERSGERNGMGRKWCVVLGVECVSATETTCLVGGLALAQQLHLERRDHGKMEMKMRMRMKMKMRAE
jgi:hypothetical protein